MLGHDSRLAQVLTNLIDNACSFSKPGGEVRVTLRRAAYAPTAEGGPGATRCGRSSTTTARASRRTRSSASSSASIPTGRSRDSARTPDWACRSRVRSSKRTAGASGPRTARRRRRRRPTTKRRAAPWRRRALRRRPAGDRSMSATPAGWTALHATAVVVGESGVLLRGPSGAGKSSLALALIWAARERAGFAALVADDRVFARALRRSPDRARRAGIRRQDRAALRRRDRGRRTSRPR